MQISSPHPLFSPAFWADPFPFFARLRAEAPVHQAILPPRTPIWLVSRYEDVQRVLKDDRFAKDRTRAMTPEQLRRMPWVPPMFRPLERNMLDRDPPDHTNLRALVQKAFTPRLVERMRGRAEALADELLDAAQARGRLDLIRDFALPLPLTIIAEILGVPPADRHRFHRWTRVIVSVNAFNISWRVFLAIWQCTRFLRRFFALRRAEPGDDLTTALIRAEEAGQSFTEDDLLAMVFLLLIAGHETTVNLIASGTLELLRHPDQLDRLRSDPALMESAVEELLRFTAPVFLATERYALEDLELRGVPIPRGGLVFAALGSANRDASAFADPDRLDVGRADNRHLGFGQGIHYCLGASLARLEARVAFEALLRRLPDLRLAAPAESLRWRKSLILRGMESLPVTF